MLPGACHVVLEVRLEAHDVASHVLEPSNLRDILHELPELRRPDPLATAEVVDDQSPRVEAVEHVGALEGLSGFALEAYVEEAPHDVAQPEHVVLGHPGLRLLLDHLRRDLVLVLGLGPVDHEKERLVLGTEVPSHGLPPLLT